MAERSLEREDGVTEAEQNALTAVVGALAGLPRNSQSRVLRTAQTFFAPSTPAAASDQKSDLPASTFGLMSREPVFGVRLEQSPKEFMLEKAPATDIERVACLAYFLTHYRDTAHFKTADISALNTEAAQARFSNAAFAVNNATTKGFLVPAGKGKKQISALGERFVDALPDREKANEVVRNLRPRKNSSRTKKQSSRKKNGTKER